jgi:hypothetical protein
VRCGGHTAVNLFAGAISRFVIQIGVVFKSRNITNRHRGTGKLIGRIVLERGGDRARRVDLARPGLDNFIRIESVTMGGNVAASKLKVLNLLQAVVS